METLFGRYNYILKYLNVKEKKYIHYRSLKNFILHVDDIVSEDDNYKSKCILNEYLDIVENSIGNIDSVITTNLFVDYLYPLGEIYKEVGFKRMFALKYSVIFSFIIDAAVGFIFFKFPYPILTIIVLVNYLIKQKKEMASSKVYSMFY